MCGRKNQARVALLCKYTLFRGHRTTLPISVAHCPNAACRSLNEAANAVRAGCCPMQVICSQRLRGVQSRPGSARRVYTMPFVCQASSGERSTYPHCGSLVWVAREQTHLWELLWEGRTWGRRHAFSRCDNAKVIPPVPSNRQPDAARAAIERICDTRHRQCARDVSRDAEDRVKRTRDRGTTAPQVRPVRRARPFCLHVSECFRVRCVGMCAAAGV